MLLHYGLVKVLRLKPYESVHQALQGYIREDIHWSARTQDNYTLLLPYH